MSEDRMDSFIWKEGDARLRDDRAVIELGGFADAELIEQFKKGDRRTRRLRAGGPFGLHQRLCRQRRTSRTGQQPAALEQAGLNHRMARTDKQSI